MARRVLIIQGHSDPRGGHFGHALADAYAQADIQWAEHLVVILPLWQGTLPALLKAFFEQVLRPGPRPLAGPDGGIRPQGRLSPGPTRDAESSTRGPETPPAELARL